MTGYLAPQGLRVRPQALQIWFLQAWPRGCRRWLAPRQLLARCRL